MIKAPFFPQYGSGQTVSPGAASATATLQAGTKNVVLTNGGLNVCYVRIGASAVAATTADMPILAGTQVVISKDQDHTALTHISPSGTTLHIMTGEGW